jgi:hypothetical protein
MRWQNRQFARHQTHRTLANDYAAIASPFVGVVGEIEYEFGLAEDTFKTFVNCRAIVCSPLNYLIECLIEDSGTVDHIVNVAGLIS